MVNASVHLKLECLQKTGSFKTRGALHAIMRLSPEQQKKGVVAASAGNHAQGGTPNFHPPAGTHRKVAFGASICNSPCTIYMPVTAPVAKQRATKSYGAEVVLCGDTLSEALAQAQEDCKKQGKTFIHPFNDENVVCGQATCGLGELCRLGSDRAEILDELPDVDAVFIPLGGGGFVVGVAMAIKRTHPHIKVYGVEAAGASSMHTSIETGVLTAVNVNTICDGIAVPRVGDITFALAQKYIDGILLVSDFEVSTALFLLLERAKIVAEPSGVAGLAAVLTKKIDLEGKKVCVVISGGNIDMGLLGRIMNRQLVELGRRIQLRGMVSEKIGGLWLSD